MAHCFGGFVVTLAMLLWSADVNVARHSGSVGGQSVAAAEPATKGEPAKSAETQPQAKNGEKVSATDAAKPAKEEGKSAAPKSAEAPKEPSKNGQPTKDGQAAKDAAAAAKAKPTPPAPTPATHTVKKGPLRITVDLDGHFEATTSQEIVVKTDEWNALVVEMAAPHGTRVRKGEVLLKLELDKIDRAIADLRAEQAISTLSIRQGEDSLRALEKLTPLDLEASVRAAKAANEDRKNFFDVDKPFALKAADFGLKMAKEQLEYEEEELHQLEKMYKADEVTEETEEIVLKRARDSVERAKFMVEANQLHHDQTLRFAIPRAEDRIKESADRRSIELERSKVQLPLAVDKQRLDIERLRVQADRSMDRLKKLESDRNAMVVKSPIDGVVYYGKATRGRFGDSTSMGESLRPNSSVMPNQVVMTVVQTRPMAIRATVPEDQLHRVRPNLKGIATPAAYPDLKLAAVVDRVSDVPTAPGSFDARLSVTLDRKSRFLMPGMACKVRLVPYLRKDAITVPPKVVMTDELDDHKHFVWLLGKDGKPEKRSVSLGQKTDKQVEITSGLSEGDKVLLEAPKEST